MTSRQRYLETMLFGHPDRVPFQPGWPRESTLRRWHSQGLPEGKHFLSHVRDEIGIEPAPEEPAPRVRINHTMIPEFEEKIIEERGDTRIVQDWKGNICEISSDFDTSYLRAAKDFVTRRWIKCPVENRADWEMMQARYDANDPSRTPEGLQSWGRDLDDRSHVEGITFHGPFWQMREWLGFEGLCIAFAEDPLLTKDMVDFWCAYISTLLLNVLPHVTLDYVLFSEDMAYKAKSMISPEMVREFLQPCYVRWNEIVRQYGVPVLDCDSDGFVGELIPIWIDSGINACNPMEVAAGNDLNAYRREYGARMAFRGGVDKRLMARGGEHIRRELARLEPVVRSGGFIPGCDHGVPSDVGLPEFVDYCDELAKLTGWK